MEHVWHPPVDSGFSGSLTIVIPPIKEQFKAMREMQSAVGEDGKLRVVEQLDMVEKQIELCSKYVKDVKLAHAKSNKTFTSFDDLLYFKQTREFVLGDIAGIVLNGIDLGKY